MMRSISAERRALSMAVTLLLVLVTAGQVQAQPTIPSTLSVAPGKLATLTITTSGNKCKWRVIGAPIDSFREYTPDTDSITLRLIAYENGTAYLLAWSAKDSLPSDAAVCVITIGDSPTPDPTPVNELTQAFQRGYDSETNPKRKQYLEYLQSVYMGAGSLLTEAITTRVLFEKLRAAYFAPGLGFKEDEMIYLRNAIGKHLAKYLPSGADDGIDLVAARKAFREITDALKGVK